VRLATVVLYDPWSRTDGGTLRMRALLNAAGRAGWDVDVYFLGSPSGPGSDRGESGRIVRRPITGAQASDRFLGRALGAVKRHFVPIGTAAGARVDALRDALANGPKPDVLLLTELRLAEYRSCAPEAALWVDMFDLQALVSQREVEARRGVARLTADLQRRSIERRERRHARHAARVTAAGYGDAQTLRASQPLAEWLPTPVSSPAVPLPLPEGRTVGLIANFEYWPNRDAYELLLDEWLVPLRQLGWGVVVAGRASQNLPSAPGVEIIGPVEDVAAFYARIRLAAVPVRLGGGIKVKLLEALSYGRPVLTSEHGVDGLPPELRSKVGVVGSRPSPSQFTRHVERAEHGLGSAQTLARDLFSTDGFNRHVATLLGSL